MKHGAHAIVADRSFAELTRDAVFFDADVLVHAGRALAVAVGADVGGARPLAAAAAHQLRAVWVSGVSVAPSAERRSMPVA